MNRVSAMIRQCHHNKTGTSCYYNNIQTKSKILFLNKEISQLTRSVVDTELIDIEF